MMESKTVRRPLADPVSPNHKRHKKIIALAALAICLLFMIAVGWFIGKPMIQFLSEPEQFQAWVDTHGLSGRLLFIGMVVVQIVIAFIPGEPLEIGAGYAFGAVEGTILCVVGSFVGSVLVFLLVRRFGMRLVEVFFSKEKIQSMKFLQNTKRLELIAFILFLIPGTPKDLLCYAAGLAPIRLPVWMIICGVARFPSIVTSTIGGSALGSQDYTFAIIVFAITIAISIAGILVYRFFQKRRSS